MLQRYQFLSCTDFSLAASESVVYAYLCLTSWKLGFKLIRQKETYLSHFNIEEVWKLSTCNSKLFSLDQTHLLNRLTHTHPLTHHHNPPTTNLSTTYRQPRKSGFWGGFNTDCAPFYHHGFVSIISKFGYYI